MRLSGAIAISTIALGSCRTPSPPPTTASVDPSAEGEPSHPEQPTAEPRPPLEPRGRFTGMEVGVEFVHGASPTVGSITLAPGLERRSTVSFADGWVFITAGERADLIVLLVDDNGIVADDVTMTGYGEHLSIVDCDAGGETYVGIVSPDGCDDGESATTVRGWSHDGRRLVEEPAEVTCWCDLVEP